MCWRSICFTWSNCSPCSTSAACELRIDPRPKYRHDNWSHYSHNKCKFFLIYWKSCNCFLWKPPLGWWIFRHELVKQETRHILDEGISSLTRILWNNIVQGHHTKTLTRDEHSCLYLLSFLEQGCFIYVLLIVLIILLR